MERQVTVKRADEGEAYWLVTDRATIKATGADTGGAYALVELVVPPQAGPPPHLHRREDEGFFILEGDFEFLAGDHTLRATAGDFVYGPRNIVHTFKNVGSTPGRILGVVSPPGFEEFVREAGVPVAESPTPPEGPPDTERLLQVAEKYGIEIMLPQ
jgi:mannose-6-phosphate isomerase-like protein (cupin superfamily)